MLRHPRVVDPAETGRFRELRLSMSRIRTFAAAAGLALAFGMAPAQAANVFRFAFQGDIKSLDPYSLKESFTIGMHAAVYEALITRDKDQIGRAHV